MILTLILAASEADAQRVSRDTRLPAIWIRPPTASPDEMRAWLKDRARGYNRISMVRVVKTDRWQYNERTINALRMLATMVKVIDPTGLLGVETAGIPPEVMAKRTITDSPPIGKNLNSGYQKPRAPRKQQPTRYGNDRHPWKG